MKREIELRWLPHLHAYAVRVGLNVIGCVACGERLPFMPLISVRYA